MELHDRLLATMPVRVTTPDAHVHEYYDPDRRAASAAVILMVKAG